MLLSFLIPYTKLIGNQEELSYNRHIKVEIEHAYFNTTRLSFVYLLKEVGITQEKTQSKVHSSHMQGLL